MSSRAILRIRFLDWWHAGTGHSGLADADMIALRDSFGCPALPMTQVKGTLRETAGRVWPAEKVSAYFGESSTPKATNDEVPEDVGQGAIRFSGLMTLNAAEAAWFAQNDMERGQLFGLLYSTAIDGVTGTAKARSLRQIEAAIPMTLTAQISLRVPLPGEDWISALDQLCALTPAFGKLKNDGYGRAIAECVPPEAAP